MKDENTQSDQNIQQNQQAEVANAPSWLKKGVKKGGETKKSPAPTAEKEAEQSKAQLPAWVRNAGGDEVVNNDSVSSSKEIVNEKTLPATEDNVENSKDKKDIPVASLETTAPAPKSIFDNLKGIFSFGPKNKPEIKNKGTIKKELAAQIDEDKSLTLAEKQLLKDTERLYQEGLSSVRDLISPSSMNIEYDKIQIDGLYTQTFYVFAYPRYLDTNWLSPIINYDVGMDISQFIYPIDSASIMRILKRKVAQMNSSIRIAQDKGNVRDPAIETALQDAEELRTQIQRGQEKFFQLGFYFTLYAEDKKKLQRIAKQLTSLLGGKLILTKRADFQAEHGFTSTLPLCLDELEVTLNMNTSPLSTMFPFTSAELTSDKGILYGLNRHNDGLVIFDRFSLENANSVVFAKSGAGKSYAVKLEILRSLMFGSDVIIIDPENEYESLCDTVGGSYMKVSLNADKRINPFDLPAPLKDEVVQPGDLLRSNIISLHGLLKIMLGGVTPAEEGLLDKALTDVYSLRGITMDVEDPSSFPPPTMEDLYDILDSMEGAKDLSIRLAKFTEGTYAGIFNQPTNIDLTSGLVVFSIRDLEDALRPIAMYIILNFIWNRVRSSLKKRLLIIDEAWSLMQHDDSAKFLNGLVKRARKYYLGITTITQDVEDFVQNKYGKPIITNSSMQLLLKQAPAALDMLQKIFNLTEGEKYMLLNSGVGQGLFFAGNKHVAIQIIASYGEDKLVTTNPEEILKAVSENIDYGEENKEEKGENDAVENNAIANDVNQENIYDVEEKNVNEVPKIDDEHNASSVANNNDSKQQDIPDGMPIQEDGSVPGKVPDPDQDQNKN